MTQASAVTVNRASSAAPPQAIIPAPAATLECRDLVKLFGGVRAMDGVTVSFEAGKVTALVGPNGAGKTTLFHIISGALRADSGEVLLRGQRIDGLPPWTVAKMGIGRLFQDVRVFGKLSVLENLLVAGLDQVGERIAHALFSRGAVAKAESRKRQQAGEWLELVSLADHEHQLAETLSHGQQKLLAIARLLAAGADVLLLDEPTAGVNPELIRRLLDVIRELAGQGRTVVLIEHNIDVVLDVADWVYFLNEGQIAAFGSPREVMGDRAVRAAYLGL